MPLMVSTPDPLSYATSLTNPRWCFNSNTTSLLYFKKTWRRHLSCMGWPHPMDRLCWMMKTVSTPHPLVLCLVTNASEVAFQPRCHLSCISRKAVSAFPDINIDPTDWPCRMTKTVSTPHPLSYASSLMHPRWRFNPDATSPVFQEKRRQLSLTLT